MKEDKTELIKTYWREVLAQNKTTLPSYFCENAHVYWHNSNECFNVEEFVIANCEYPNTWQGEIERLELHGEQAITVTKVYSIDGQCSFHAVSFFQFQEGKILRLDEYWGDDGCPPSWRADMHIGSPITM